MKVCWEANDCGEALFAFLTYKYFINPDQSISRNLYSKWMSKMACAGYVAYPFKNQEVHTYYKKPLRHLLMHTMSRKRMVEPS